MSQARPKKSKNRLEARRERRKAQVETDLIPVKKYAQTEVSAVPTFTMSRHHWYLVIIDIASYMSQNAKKNVTKCNVTKCQKNLSKSTGGVVILLVAFARRKTALLFLTSLKWLVFSWHKTLKSTQASLQRISVEISGQTLCTRNRVVSSSVFNTHGHVSKIGPKYSCVLTWRYGK